VEIIDTKERLLDWAMYEAVIYNEYASKAFDEFILNPSVGKARVIWAMTGATKPVDWASIKE
jgi:hypothetical protein